MAGTEPRDAVEWTQAPGGTARADCHREASVETGIALTRFPAENPWGVEEALAYAPPTPVPREAKRQRNRLVRRASEAGTG